MLPGLGNVALTRIVPILGSTSRSTASTDPRCGYELPSARTSVSPPPPCHSLAAAAGVLTWSAMARYSCSLIGKYDLDRIDLRDRRQERRRSDEIADLRDGDRRDAVDERRDSREAEIQLRGFHCCLADATAALAASRALTSLSS